MQRLLHEIFCIAFVIASTFIYGNLIMLMMNKIIKDKTLLPLPILPLQKNTSFTSPININTTYDLDSNPNLNLKIHYATMLIFAENDNLDI